MSTVAQLRDRVYRQTKFEYNDNIHILDLLNDALSNLVDAGKLRKKTTINAVVGTAIYSLPTDFKAPGILQDETNENYVITYDLVGISENRYGYAVEAGNIYLKPSPLENKALTHYYYKYAVPLVNDTDVPTDIDPQYHNLLALYAVAMIVPILKHDTSTRYAISAQNMYETRQWQMWQDGLKGFVEAQARKNRGSKVREKVIW